MEQKGQLLARVPLFAGVTAAGIEELGAIADEVEVRPGTVLTHQGYRTAPGSVRMIESAPRNPIAPRLAFRPFT